MSIFFKKKQEVFDKYHMEADFKIHGGWGDHIEWLSPEQFQKEFTEKTLFSVYGHSFTIPKKGQTLIGEFKRSFMKFEFVSVERESDPPDMFFGKVKIIGQFLKESIQ